VDALLDIVEMMAKDGSVEFNLTELATGLNLSNNLVFRVMNRLLERGYAEKSDSGAYRLSEGFFVLGMKLHSRFELRLAAGKRLEKLSAETGETAQLQVLSGDEMLVLEVAPPSTDYYLHVTPGIRLLAHCNAYGKAVLAFKSENVVDAVLSNGLKRLTDNTITTRKNFLKELESVRMTGLAYDREEYSKGVVCVGAPVFNCDGEGVAGLGLTGLASRFNPEDSPAIGGEVLNCAELVSRGIGYDGEFFESRKKQ
jgi:DNA-binding IclR family transcriptional regulator